MCAGPARSPSWSLLDHLHRTHAPREHCLTAVFLSSLSEAQGEAWLSHENCGVREEMPVRPVVAGGSVSKHCGGAP